MKNCGSLWGLVSEVCILFAALPCCVLCGSVLFPDQMSPSPVLQEELSRDAACRKALDDVFLNEQGQGQHRQGDDGGRRA
jgi:hypothetical protein